MKARTFALYNFIGAGHSAAINSSNRRFKYLKITYQNCIFNKSTEQLKVFGKTPPNIYFPYL